jgi:hypothetical protein
MRLPRLRTSKSRSVSVPLRGALGRRVSISACRRHEDFVQIANPIGAPGRLHGRMERMARRVPPEMSLLEEVPLQEDGDPNGERNCAEDQADDHPCAHVVVFRPEFLVRSHDPRPNGGSLRHGTRWARTRFPRGRRPARWAIEAKPCDLRSVENLAPPSLPRWSMPKRLSLSPAQRAYDGRGAPWTGRRPLFCNELTADRK